MIRVTVRRSVTDRRPIDDTERAMIVEFLDRFDALADPFDERLDPVHVTGSAIVIDDRLGVLLLEHKRLGMWLQPGGHLDPGETPWQAAEREAIEETGLDLELVDADLVHVDVHPGGRGHTHLDLRYLVRVRAGTNPTPRPPVGESQLVEWFGWRAAIERASDERLTALLRALAP